MGRGSTPAHTRTPDHTPGTRPRARRRPRTRHRAATTRTTLLMAVGLALTASLGACTGTEPAPEWTPATATPLAPTAPTPTPTTDPAATKPQRPTAMDTPDAAGAEAAARYFMDLYAYVYATGDLEEWRQLSHPDCAFCASVIANVEEQAASGQHTTGGVATITDVSSLETDPGAWWSVDLELIQGPATVRDAAGGVLSERADPVAYHADVAVARQGDRWQIRAVDHQKIDQSAATP